MGKVTVWEYKKWLFVYRNQDKKIHDVAFGPYTSTALYDYWMQQHGATLQTDSGIV